jgi:large subunit ribosomal protein L37e
MSKGTPSMGRHNKTTHIRCRRCGRCSYHIQKKKCGACGYGASKKIYKMAWKTKNLTRTKRKIRIPFHKKPIGVHKKPRWGKSRKIS